MRCRCLSKRSRHRILSCRGSWENALNNNIINRYSNTYLCLDEEDALLFRLAPGDLELRELEFEELRVQRDAREGTHTHITRMSSRARTQTDKWIPNDTHADEVEMSIDSNTETDRLLVMEAKPNGQGRDKAGEKFTLVILTLFLTAF